MELKEGYKQTEAGVIPKDWNAKPLKGKISIAHGFPFASEHFGSHGQFRLTTPGHFHEEGGFRDIGEKQKFYLGPVINNYVLRPGEMIVAMTEQADGLLGSAALIPQVEGFLHNQRLGRVRALSAEIDLVYLFYVFNSPTYRSKVRQTAAGTKVKHTSPERLLKIEIPLPSPSEQRAIAKVLSDVDEVIAALGAHIAKKRAIKQSAMQQLLSGKVRLSGFSGKWELKILRDILEKIVGGGTPSRANPAYWGNEIQWVTVKDFATFNPRQTQESITIVGLKNSASNLIPAGTLITSTRMALGKAMVYEVDVAINQDLKALFLKPQVSVRFLSYWFEYFGKRIDDLGSGSTVKGISLGQLNQLPFYSPCLPEQTAISEILADIDKDITALEARRDKTRAIKQGMMQQLLTGRIRLVKPQPAEAEA